MIKNILNVLNIKGEEERVLYIVFSTYIDNATRLITDSISETT